MSAVGIKPALYWEPAGGGRVHCLLCPHGCEIAEGKQGRCKVRENAGGALQALNYSRVSAANLDPIEKKPLFHFYPGSLILSLGSIGCNLSCAFCQNWSISQELAGTRRMSPDQAIAAAQSEAGNIGIAYTYNEPFVSYEFLLETAQAAKAVGLKNVLVTNGYINEEPLRRILPYIDAMNVDIKAMSDDFYRELCRGRAEPARRTVEIAASEGCLVEVTNLVIPNWNDSHADLTQLVDWAAGVSPEMPVHFSRYHPDYKFTEPPTPAETLSHARQLAREKLHYVYVGNLWGGEGENTICPNCGEVVVERRGFSVFRVSVKEERCGFCGGRVRIVGT